MTITKKVIDKLEGGYWNPKCGHPSSGMGILQMNEPCKSF
jgi:hypothetical protein